MLQGFAPMNKRQGLKRRRIRRRARQRLTPVFCPLLTGTAKRGDEGMNLRDIQSPEAVKRLRRDELPELAEAIRKRVIETVARNGGHLSSNLGIVELTIALHRVFDCPKDKIIFDVGHQCYPHKLLTGRDPMFDSLRTYEGLCGFPRAAESSCDAYDTGHASTAISAAVGMARARDLLGEDYNVIAVVGDGAMTGGMCYEALNDAGSAKMRMIVILNDNGMSISGNVGALTKYLLHLRTSKGWMKTKQAVAQVLLKVPVCGNALHDLFQRIKNSIRNIFIRDNFFTALGFHYFGPVDGQDAAGLEHILRRVKTLDEPVLLHVVTKKGFGYTPAENMPDVFHGTPPFQVESGEQSAVPQEHSFGEHAGKVLTEMAEKDPRICVVTAAMTGGTGMEGFQRAHPERLFDVGIAEEHAVTMAAGMARGGLKPVVAIYDTFMQRAFDQLMEDVCLQDLPVVLLMDRAALSGADGATHHGVFGLSYLSPMPNMQLLCPRSCGELEQMLRYALSCAHPVAIRYPHFENGAAHYPLRRPFAVGRWETIREGKDLTLLCVNPMLETGLRVRDILMQSGLSAAVVNASCVKPLDEQMLRALTGKPVFTLEEHVLRGGFGSQVNAWYAQHGLPPAAFAFGLPDRFMAHGDRASLLAECGLDAESIARKIIKGETVA